MSKANRTKGLFNELLVCRVAVTTEQLQREQRIAFRHEREAGFTVVERTSRNMPVRAMKRMAQSGKREAKRFTPHKQEQGLRGYQFTMAVLSRGCKVGAA